MANSDSPFGFRPVKNLNGASWNGAGKKVYWAGDTSVSLFVHDPVRLSGTGDDDGIPGIVRSEAGEGAAGVIVGIDGDSNGDLTRDTNRYLSTSAGYAIMVPVEDAYFEVQEDSDAGALAKTNIGNTINHIFGTASTSHPIISAAELDSSSADTSSTTKTWRVEALSQRDDNTIGSNAKWVVRCQNIDDGPVN